MAHASHDLPTAPSGDAPDPAPILQLGLGFWASKTLLSAVELGVFTELAHEPLDAETLRARLGLHPRATLDFLDALVALGMLQRDERGYVDTPETALFLDRESPAYVGGLLEMANERLYPFWASLTEALRTGQPQSEIKTGGNFFGVLYQDEERLRQFMRCMTGLSTGASRAIAAKFPWHEHETFIDVGTAEGGLPVTVALARAPRGGRSVAADRRIDRQRTDDAISDFRLPLGSCDASSAGSSNPRGWPSTAHKASIGRLFHGRALAALRRDMEAPVEAAERSRSAPRRLPTSAPR